MTVSKRLHPASSMLPQCDRRTCSAPTEESVVTIAELSPATQLPISNSISAMTSGEGQEKKREFAEFKETIAATRPAKAANSQEALQLQPNTTRHQSSHPHYYGDRRHTRRRCSSTGPTTDHRYQPRSLLNQLVAAMALLHCALLLLPVAPRVEALICYETGANGKTIIKQNDSWTYCALVPATIHGKELINGSQFGLGPGNDMLGAYNTMFGMNNEDYRVLTICLYERYDFSRYLPMKPTEGAVEFTFRCICNYDLCNSETTFSAYLTTIKAESFSAPVVTQTRQQLPSAETMEDAGKEAGERRRRR